MRSLWNVGCFLLLAPILFAQTDRGTITGTVTEGIRNVFDRTAMTDPTSTNAGAAQLYDAVTKNTSSGFGYISPSQTAVSLRPREGLVIAKLRF